MQRHRANDGLGSDNANALAVFPALVDKRYPA